MLGKLEEKDLVMQDLPPVSLIRCGIQDYGKRKEGDASKPTTEELFRYLEDQVPWLVSEEGLKYEVSFSIFGIYVCIENSLDTATAMGNTLHLPILHRNPFTTNTRRRRKARSTTRALDV